MACGQVRLPASQVSLMPTTTTEILSSGDKKVLDKHTNLCYNKDTKNKGDNYYEKEQEED